MACLGVLFAITPAEAARLLDAQDDGDDEALLAVVADLEAAWDEAHLHETDRAWDPIHRCLGDGTLDLLALGGEMLDAEDASFVVHLDPDTCDGPSRRSPR